MKRVTEMKIGWLKMPTILRADWKLGSFGVEGLEGFLNGRIRVVFWGQIGGGVNGGLKGLMFVRQFYVILNIHHVFHHFEKVNYERNENCREFLEFG